MIWPLLTLALKAESDIVMARQRARTVAEALGFDTQDQTRVATAVSEIARNAFGYGGGGKIEFGVEDGALQSLVAVVTDHGPGIAQLEDILAGTYSSATGMGLGMVGARRLMDRFEVGSEPGRGTRVTLGKVLPPARLRLTGKAVGEIRPGSLKPILGWKIDFDQAVIGLVRQFIGDGFQHDREADLARRRLRFRQCGDELLARHGHAIARQDLLAVGLVDRPTAGLCRGEPGQAILRLDGQGFWARF